MGDVDYMSYEDSLNYYFEENELNQEFYSQTLHDVWDNCILESISSILQELLKIIITNLFFGILISTVNLSETVFHCLFGLCGIYLIHILDTTYGIILLITCFLCSYLLLNYINTLVSKSIEKKKQTHYFTFTNLALLSLMFTCVSCQYFLLDSDIWQKIRGPIMIFSMKFISLADDIENGSNLPSFLQYFGYLFCGANILFGPWISYEHYKSLYLDTPKKNIQWIFALFKSLFYGLLFLIASNCIADFLIPDDSHILLTSYKEAFSFRTSHYFVSYLSETAMLAAGFKSLLIWNDGKWNFTVSNPFVIEFPTALSIVVTNWNQPMHHFLKKYVYKLWLPCGKFFAILITFIVSSFLHGFELKVSVVLISLGIFSYLQYAVRYIISNAFSCCVNVFPCKKCNHIYKREHFRSRIMILIFSVFTIFHLIFVGILMDPSTDKIGIIKKWSNLYFYSIWIMLINCLIVFA